MRIKLALLDDDENYINKVASALNSRYSQTLELYVFSDKEIMEKTIDLHQINVLLVNHYLLDLDTVSLDKVAKAYLIDTGDVISMKGHKAIHKFQKIDDIYKSIKELYEEVYEIETKKGNVFSTSTQCNVYTSFSGGTGTSLVAMSEAITKAKKNEKVLYLNLEYFDSTSLYFEGEKSETFGDVIFAIKRKTKNLEAKLEQFINKDEKTGVYFFNQTNVLLDKLEMFNVGDFTILFNALKNMGFDNIIIDRNISFTEDERYLYSIADKIRFVVDGTEISNQKFLRLMNSLPLIDERNKTDHCSKVEVIYNKMSTSSNNRINNDIKIIASINKYKTDKDKDIIDEIVNKQYLARI